MDFWLVGPKLRLPSFATLMHLILLLTVAKLLSLAKVNVLIRQGRSESNPLFCISLLVARILEVKRAYRSLTQISILAVNGQAVLNTIVPVTTRKLHQKLVTLVVAVYKASF